MRHSATTDTLDSVYLDPSVEHELEGEKTIEEQNEDQSPEFTAPQKEKGPVRATVTVSKNEVCALGLDNSSSKDQTSGDTNDDMLFTLEGKEITGGPEESPPSLSKYFGKETGSDDPFESIIGTGETYDDNRQGDMQGSNENLLKDIANEMTDLTLDDAKDLVDENVIVKEHEDNHLGSSKRSEELNVDFELTLDNNEPVETPEDIEEKDDFESFTAYAADTEALDALGMSPAAPSYLTEKNMAEFFHRQASQTSGKSSSIEHNTIPESLEEEIENDALPPVSTPPHVEKAESSLPAPDMSRQAPAIEAKSSAPVEATPTHQPVFPPSTTLSPVDSPIHQPVFNKPFEQHISVSSSPSSPEHRLTAFQDVGESSDDVFSLSLQMSDSDRRHDAWLPSEATKKVLITVATHTAGTYLPDPEMLCSPSLVITEPQGDPVRDLVYRYMGEQEALKRQVLTTNKVSQDTEGLKKLMASGCYRSAIDLTGKLLADMGQGEEREQSTVHSPESLQLWQCRFSLMMKLRMYSVLESEFAAFKNLDTPDIYYEFYPEKYPGKRGSMVSFGMRLLHAELPHHLGRSSETLDRLYYLLAITEKILKNLDEGLSEDGSAVTISNESRKVSKELWQERDKRVLYSVANILVALRDYDAALSVYESLLEKDASHHIALLSGLGRIYLQIGNLAKATEYFQRAKEQERGSDSTQVNTTNLMNNGFLAMCQNNFNEAYLSFKQAVDADPLNTSAVNNMAVCCLYLGRLKEALKSLEALVHRDPTTNLHEGILFNLCTLYELESSRALHKKQALLDLVSKHKGDGFPVVCLKMQ